MISRILNTLLVTTAIAGIVASLFARSAQGPIRDEYSRLVASVGRLDVTDPDRFHVRSMPNNDPYHFAWRVYKPDNIDLRCQSVRPNGSGYGTSTGPAGESIFRIRFKFTDNGMYTYFKHGGGSSTGSDGNAVTAAFLHQHWDELEIVDVCQDGPISEGRDKVIALLSIRVPESLHDELKQAVGAQSNLLDTPLITIEIGSNEAFDATK